MNKNLILAGLLCLSIHSTLWAENVYMGGHVSSIAVNSVITRDEEFKFDASDIKLAGFTAGWNYKNASVEGTFSTGGVKGAYVDALLNWQARLKFSDTAFVTPFISLGISYMYSNDLGVARYALSNGLGLNFRFGSRVSASLEYMKYAKRDEYKSDGIVTAVKFHF